MVPAGSNRVAGRNRSPLDMHPRHDGTGSWRIARVPSEVYRHHPAPRHMCKISTYLWPSPVGEYTAGRRIIRLPANFAPAPLHRLLGGALNTKDLSYIAIFAALVAALGLFPPISVPVVAVPITMQTMGVMLAGAILGARRGALSMLTFLAVVAMGVPALSGGRGGLGVFFGPSGGFLLGWPVGAYVVGRLTERAYDRYSLSRGFAYNVVGGIAAVYLGGIPWLAAVTEISLLQAAVGSAAFLPGDVIKAAVAAWVAVGVRRAYPLLEGAGAR